MASIIIFVLLLVGVFGPMIVFGIVGYKAIEELGKRPMHGGQVMIPLILKLVVTSIILIGLMMFVLELFG